LHLVVPEKSAVGKLAEERILAVDDEDELVNGWEGLVGIESEVAGVVVGEVVGAVAIANYEELHEVEQRLGVAGIVLVFDDLLHNPARTDMPRV
jgi:hypothetical protein